jgi:hypothetical protein
MASATRGKLWAGAEPSSPAVLSGLDASTVYFKADAGASFQMALTAPDALRGGSVALLTTPPRHSGQAKVTPPYGMKIAVSREDDRGDRGGVSAGSGAGRPIPRAFDRELLLSRPVSD